MFWFGRKKDSEVVEAVCAKIRPLFGILAHRPGGITPQLANDPYVLGYVIGAATIFAQIETSGKATTSKPHAPLSTSITGQLCQASWQVRTFGRVASGATQFPVAPRKVYLHALPKDILASPAQCSQNWQYRRY